MLSALLAPILIWGGAPVNFRKLSKVLMKKLFCEPDEVFTQSVHRSPSIERDTKVGDNLTAVCGCVSASCIMILNVP